MSGSLSSQILTPPTASQGRGHFSKWRNCPNPHLRRRFRSLLLCTLSGILSSPSGFLLLEVVQHSFRSCSPWTLSQARYSLLHHLPYSVLTTSTLGKNNQHFLLLRLAAQPGLYLFCTAYIVGEAHKSLSVKSANSGVGQLEFKSDSQPLLCVWAWTWFLISVCLSFLFYMDTVIVLNL